MNLILFIPQDKKQICVILKNKNIFVTGAGKGIGLDTVKTAIKEGAFVYALTRSKTNIKELKKIKSNIQAIQSIIYKNIFLDKKKINQFPRYIKLTKLGKAKVMEMKNYDQLNETIFKIIF